MTARLPLDALGHERLRHWQARTFVVTWLAYVGYYLTRKSFSVAKVELKNPEVLGISTEALSWMDGGYSIAYAIGQFSWGMLGDRFGTRAVVLAGMTASVVVAVATGCASSVAVIGVLMAMQGACQSSGWAPLAKNMGEFFPRRVRGRVMGLWCSNFALGSFIGAWVAGAGAMLGGTAVALPAWRMTFLLPAAGLAAIAVVFAIVQANRPEDVGLPGPEVEAGEPETVVVAGQTVAEESEGSWAVIREVLRSRIVLLIAGVYLLVKPLRYLLMFWAPVYVSERLGTSAAESGVIGSLFDLAGPLGIFAGGWLSDRIFGARRFPVMAITLAAGALALTVLPLVPATRSSLGVTLFLVGMLVYIPDSLAIGAAAIDFGTRRGAGTAVGLINGCGSIGQTVGVMLPGIVKQATGSATTPWNAIFLGLAGGLVIAAVLVAPQWNRLPATAARG